MKKHFFLIIGLALLIAGCQSAPQTQELGEGAAPVGLPYSKGPTSPPNMKGPNGPVPGAEDADQTESQPQAVTETETVRYTLPESKSPEFKQ